MTLLHRVCVRVWFRCDKIWQAAETLGSGFKLFFSVDLTGSLGNMAGDIVAMTSRYANRPNTLKVDGKVFLSTFVGQDKTFGYPTPQQGWDQAVITPLRNQGVPVYFVPFFAPNNERPGTFILVRLCIARASALLTRSVCVRACVCVCVCARAGQVGYPSPQQVVDVFSQFPYLDGIYQWSAWPFFYGDLQDVSNQADVNYLYALAGASPARDATRSRESHSVDLLSLSLVLRPGRSASRTWRPSAPGSPSTWPAPPSLCPTGYRRRSRPRPRRALCPLSHHTRDHARNCAGLW
jgi:hypothetical protein